MNTPREQGIRLDWPKVKPPRRAFLRLCIGGLCVVIAMSLMGTWLWLATGLVTSGNAVVDGRTYTLTARMTDTVSQVLVQAGQNVAAGEPLLRLSGLGYQAALPEARHQAQAVRPPTMEESAERVAKAEAMEASMVQRIAMARGEEMNTRKLMEDSVAAHVKAQLTMRSMDAQGQQQQASYKKAVQAEFEARRTMDAVRMAAEQASRARVAVEAELERVRREIAFAAANGAYSAGQAAAGQPASAAVAPTESVSVLTAPVAGRVVSVQAAAGQRVDRGQALVQMVPADANELWVLAAFAEQDIARIHPGQTCTIRLEAYAGQVLQGQVESIMPASEAVMQLLHPREAGQAKDRPNSEPTSKAAGASATVRIPVRVRFVPQEGQTMPEMFLGMGGSVKVQTRPVPAFLARWL